MAVAERQRHGPGDLGLLGDVLVALPGDVVGRVADAEHRIEQQLDAAAARADDEIGAGDGVGEALARAGAHLLDAEQQHDADRDRGDGEQRRHPAVAQRLQGEAQDDHAERLGGGLSGARRSRRGARRGRSGAPSVSSWLTMISAAPAASSSPNSRSRNAIWRLRSSAEVGSSAMTRSGRPISARAAATRCCWPTLRFAADAAGDVPLVEAEAGEQPRASALRRLRAARARAACRGEAQRQQHVVDDRAVGQQVEHLEDDAEVLGAEAVALRRHRASRCRCRARRCVPASGRDDAGDQARNVDLPLPDGPISSSFSRAASVNQRPRCRTHSAPARRRRRPACGVCQCSRSCWTEGCSCDCNIFDGDEPRTHGGELALPRTGELAPHLAMMWIVRQWIEPDLERLGAQGARCEAY